MDCEKYQLTNDFILYDYEALDIHNTFLFQNNWNMSDEKVQGNMERAVNTVFK